MLLSVFNRPPFPPCPARCREACRGPFIAEAIGHARSHFAFRLRLSYLPRRAICRDAAALACVCRATAAAAQASRWHSAVRVSKSGAVLEPASGAFDVTVAPGDNVQAAVDACPAGGCVLLLPGTYDGPLVLAGKVVHVFGRGRATLRAATGTVVTSEAAEGMLDGLIIRREAGGVYGSYHDCVWIKGGRLRLQACDVTSAAPHVHCIRIDGGADPTLMACKCVLARALSLPSGLTFCGSERGPVASVQLVAGRSRGLSGGRSAVPSNHPLSAVG